MKKQKTINKSQKLKLVLKKIKDPESRKFVKGLTEIVVSPSQERKLLEKVAEDARKNPEKQKEIIKEVEKLKTFKSGR